MLRVDREAGGANASQIAEPARGVSMRLFDGHARGDGVVHAGLEVKRELVVEVRRRVAAPEPQIAVPEMISRRGWRVRRVAHDQAHSGRSVPPSTLATAAAKADQEWASLRSSSRPRAVI